MDWRIHLLPRLWGYALHDVRGRFFETGPGTGSEALGTSFSAPLVAGVVARLIQTSAVAAPTSGSGVELIRLVIQDMADLSGTDPDGTPLDHPWAPLGAVSYSYDGVREGVAQAP